MQIKCYVRRCAELSVLRTVMGNEKSKLIVNFVICMKKKILLIVGYVKSCRIRWIDHLARMLNTTAVKRGFYSVPAVPRPKGRPCITLFLTWIYAISHKRTYKGKQLRSLLIIIKRTIFCKNFTLLYLFLTNFLTPILWCLRVKNCRLQRVKLQKLSHQQSFYAEKVIQYPYAKVK